VGDWDSVTLLDGATLEQRARVDTDAFLGATDLAFDADDRVLAVGSTDGEDTGLGSLAAGTESAKVALVDAVSGRSTREPVTLPGYLYDLAFQPGSDTLAVALSTQDTSSGSNGRVVFVDAATGKLDGELPGDFESATTVAFSSDGSLMATGHPGGVVNLWRADDRQLEATLQSADQADVTVLAFDPTGRRLAFGTRQFAEVEGDDGSTMYSDVEHTVEVWELGSEPRRVRQIAGHPGRDTAAIAFSPDGTRLAVGAGNLSGDPAGPLSLWDLATGEAMIAPRSLVEEVTDMSVASAVAGFLVAAGDQDGVFLTQLDVDSWIDAACDIAGRELTDEEWATFVGTQPRRATC
jgi:WD40 repeat protein